MDTGKTERPDADVGNVLIDEENTKKDTETGGDTSLGSEIGNGQEADKAEVAKPEVEQEMAQYSELLQDGVGSSDSPSETSSRKQSMNVVPATIQETPLSDGEVSRSDSVDTEKLKELKTDESRTLEDCKSEIPEASPLTSDRGPETNRSEHPGMPSTNGHLKRRKVEGSTIYGGQSRVPYFKSAHAHIQCLQAPQAAQNPVTVSRSKMPPGLVRLATVTMAPKVKTTPSPVSSLYYEEPRRPRKVLTWDQANNARPPLRVDMEGPTPWSYSPRNKPLNETNAPSWTFGSRCSPEREGGSRTSWAKTWFQNSNVWQTKVDFISDTRWPSPNAYIKSSLLGPRQRTMLEYPAFSMGRKGVFTYVKPGADKEPSPLEYDKTLADRIMYRSHPSFTHQFRREGTILWGSSESTPGPGAYSPSTSTRPHNPAFSIKGIRREKSHVLGPYSTF